jgi:hypothetical protein
MIWLALYLLEIEFAAYNFSTKPLARELPSEFQHAQERQ